MTKHLNNRLTKRIIKLAKETTLIALIVCIVAITALATNFMAEKNMGGKATLTPTFSNGLAESNTELQAQTTSSESIQTTGCSALDSECQDNPSDGCDVRNKDFVLTTSYNFPTGIDICADNRLVDCQGNSLTGTGTAPSGITNVDYDGVTIRNCKISGYGVGIVLGSWIIPPPLIYDNTVTGNTLTGSIDGLSMRGAWTTTITNNIMSGNTNGMQAAYLKANIIQGNTFTDNTAIAIDVGGDDLLIADNQIKKNARGIVNVGNNNQILRNLVTDNKISGISIPDYIGYSSFDTNIKDNTVKNNGNGIEIQIKSNGNNVIENNIINSNTQYGVYLFQQGNTNVVRNNKVCYNQVSDFQLESSASTGDLNTCDKPDGWNDAGKTGCTYPCTTGSTLGCGDPTSGCDITCPAGYTCTGYNSGGCQGNCTKALAVNWAYYNANCGELHNININWGTTLEVDTIGFYVQWSDNQNGQYTTVSPLIYATGSGSNYHWPDTNTDQSPNTPKNGIYNWYKVQELTVNGPGDTTNPFTTDHICDQTIHCGGIANLPCPEGMKCVCPPPGKTGGTTNDEFCTCQPQGGLGSG